MENILDYQLFRIGQTSVTVASLAVSLLLVTGSWILARFTRKLVANRLLARTRLALGMRYAIGRVAGYLVFFLGAVVSLQTIGINATTLAAFGAAVGVGIGFGLQDIVKNFVAGLILLVERSVQVGDRVEVDKTAGDVVEIRARATVVRTNDDVYLIVPNSKLVTEIVTNRSFRHERVRCRVPVGVAYGSDPRAVETALLAAAARCEGVLKDPAPSVRFRAFGQSALEFELLCWTDQMLHRPGALTSALNFLVSEELGARGIEIPFPETIVHIERARERTSQGRGRSAGTEDANSPVWEAVMNRDEWEGKKEQLKGRVKEAAGVLTDDEQMEREGAEERSRGEAQETIGKARRKVGEAIEELGEKIKR